MLMAGARAYVSARALMLCYGRRDASQRYGDQMTDHMEMRSVTRCALMLSARDGVAELTLFTEH